MILQRIRQHERGLLFRYGDFVRILAPGRYWTPSRLFTRRRTRVEVVNTLKPRFDHELLEVIARQPEAQDELLIVELNDDQRALVWKDERLVEILGPGRHAYWKANSSLRVEIINIESIRFEHPRLDVILENADASKRLFTIYVDPSEDVLLFRNGRLMERLGEGRHVFWTGTGRLIPRAVDRREQVLDVSGQEIMAKDKVTLRVNLLVGYRVSNPVEAVTVVSDFSQALYRESQLALRSAIGTRTLDELLSDKESIGDEVKTVIARRASEFGVSVRSVGLRDIILPGEMKLILNQVITAEKEAQANLIRRREETAAARSQANTAKLLADNPVLARMKELEALQSILQGAKSTFVFGSGELTGQIRRLIDQEPN
ncbi:MAG: slipin family protein [Phycisphaerales bacterium]|nr:MAG: slipin family protein [Phycisphaerales bacterium]